MNRPNDRISSERLDEEFAAHRNSGGIRGEFAFSDESERAIRCRVLSVLAYHQNSETVGRMIEANIACLNGRGIHDVESEFYEDLPPLAMVWGWYPDPELYSPSCDEGAQKIEHAMDEEVERALESVVRRSEGAHQADATKDTFG